MLNKNGLIEYEGINDCNLKNIHLFKQFQYDFVFYLPKGKPDIEYITKVWVEIDMIKKKAVQTPIATSLEGQHLSGHKILFLANCYYKVEYVASGCSQTLHTATQADMFASSLALKERDIQAALLHANILIEDIYTEKLNARTSFNTLTMILFLNNC